MCVCITYSFKQPICLLVVLAPYHYTGQHGNTTHEIHEAMQQWTVESRIHTLTVINAQACHTEARLVL